MERPPGKTDRDTIFTAIFRRCAIFERQTVPVPQAVKSPLNRETAGVHTEKDLLRRPKYLQTAAVQFLAARRQIFRCRRTIRMMRWHSCL